MTRTILTIALISGLSVVCGCSLEGDSDTTVFADMLDNFSPPTPSEAARDAFNVYDPDKRRKALNLLTTSYFGGEEPYLRTYRLLLDDHDPSVKAACVKALGIHGTVEDAELIAGKLKDDSPFVRWEAARALQRIHNPAAIDALRDAVAHDEDADVRMTAADALGQYPRRSVFDTLVGALTDTNFGTTLSARRSLETLTGNDHGNDPGDWMDWANENSSTLFSQQRLYVYQPYNEPPGKIDKMKFWEDHVPVAPRTPIGLDDSETIIPEAEG